MTKTEITALDKSNMHSVLTNFPAQVQEGIGLGRDIGAIRVPDTCRHILVLGMGGSAIGGDLLRTYFASQKQRTPRIVSVLRNYNVPDVLTSDDFVIASSYSGNTEETLSAFAQAVKRTKHVLCISSGGELTLQARSYSFPLIRLPQGLQPRCAVGLSFFPLLTALSAPEIVGDEAAEETEKAILETVALLKKKSEIFSKPDKKNPALKLAEELAGTIPVIYAPSESFEAVGLRWRNQLHENAKQIAFGNVLPEMNHNEIESWTYPKKGGKKFTPVFLRDIEEHPRVALRFEALEELIGKRTGNIHAVWSDGRSLLARMFSLLYFGDWVSFYLAILNGADPTEIPTISKLKVILSKKA